jgi:hypothetical protein
MLAREKNLCQIASLLTLALIFSPMSARGEKPTASRRPQTQPSAGQVVSVNGRVRSGNRSLQPGDGLVAGDVVRAEEDSGAKILLADRSIIDIGPSSSLRIESYVANAGPDREVVLAIEKGKIRASIKKKLEGQGKFLLRTPASVLAVRGTELLVDVGASGGRSNESVVVREGNVVAEMAGGGGTVNIPQGRRMEASATRSGSGWAVQGNSFRVAPVANADMAGAFSRGTVVDRSFLQGVQIREGDTLFRGRETVQTLAVNFNAPPPLPADWRPDPGQVLKDQTPTKPESSATLRRTGTDQAIDIGGSNVPEVDISVIFKP